MADTNESGGFEICPRCGGRFETGFFIRCKGLSFVSPKKFEKLTFVDEDLVRTSLLGKIFVSLAEYYRSYRCLSCKVYLIDYSVSYRRKEVNEMAKQMLEEA